MQREGAVLMQREGTKEKPIEYDSRLMKPAHRTEGVMATNF